MISRKNKSMAYLLRKVLLYVDRHYIKFLSDAVFCKLEYQNVAGRTLNLDTPKTFCDKLNWLKLHDHNPLLQQLADKYAVREYVKEQIGEEYLVPLYGVWDDVDAIDFDCLPNRFVLKCTHDSGSVIICRNKADFNIAAAKEKLKKAMRFDWFRFRRESAYKGMKPRIVCEAYIYEQDDIADYPDYKFFCFHGEAKAMEVNSRRNTPEGIHCDFFDEQGKHLDMMEGVGQPNGMVLNLPPEWKAMKTLAEKLSAPFIHVRMDFLLHKGHIYFSEFTFYHCGAVEPFVPDEWNHIFGDWMILPEYKKENY